MHFLIFIHPSQESKHSSYSNITMGCNDMKWMYCRYLTNQISHKDHWLILFYNDNTLTNAYQKICKCFPINFQLLTTLIMYWQLYYLIFIKQSMTICTQLFFYMHMPLFAASTPLHSSLTTLCLHIKLLSFNDICCHVHGR